ncbi:SMP-30/gluconolactonase/LRE family protein [Actinoplanes sp. NPDC026623]|uniref:SMP-30/gluconolactonase/LRE family protein n=1 Tax=Actinoplanes sp. NPDC026623 TaxID=3155610 RepID=UPI0033DF913E
MRHTADVACAEVFGLGEGPVWDGPRERLLWVDIPAGAVHEGRLDGDRVIVTAAHRLDRTVGAVVCSATGELLVAGAKTLLPSGARVIPETARHRRLNDGACDPAGRFLVGSMSLDRTRHGETLVRLEHDGTLTVLDDDLTLSNGLAWSPDGTLLYSIDSVPGIVWVRPYDVATGAAGPRREWLRIGDGVPDGMCADADGHLWIAIWGAGEVRRFTPDARPTGDVVEVAAPHTSSVAFVGPGLDRLLITTATAELGADRLAAYPMSGRLFLVRVGVTGLPVAPWAGATPGES